MGLEIQRVAAPFLVVAMADRLVEGGSLSEKKKKKEVRIRMDTLEEKHA